MKWPVKRIVDNGNVPLKFTQEVGIKGLLMEREEDVLDVSLVKIDGTLLYDNYSVLAQFSIQTNLVLPSSRSLEPVVVSMDIAVSERYVALDELSRYTDKEDVEIIIPLDNPYIDLSESIVDNILLNIPIQVLSDQEQSTEKLPSGEGWSLYTEETYEVYKQQERESMVDPRLAGLTALLSE